MAFRAENLPNAANEEDAERSNSEGIRPLIQLAAPAPWGARSKPLFVRAQKALLILWSELKHELLTESLPDIFN